MLWPYTFQHTRHGDCVSGTSRLSTGALACPRLTVLRCRCQSGTEHAVCLVEHGRTDVAVTCTSRKSCPSPSIRVGAAPRWAALKQHFRVSCLRSAATSATRKTGRPTTPGFGNCGRHEACRSGRPRQALDGLPVMRVAWVPALLKCKGPTGLLQQQAEHGAGQYLHHWTRDKGRVSATLDLSGNPTPDPIQRGRLASKRTSHFPPANFPSFTTHTAPLCKRPSIFTHSYGHDAQHARLCCAGSHAAGPRYVPPGCSHAPWQPVCAAAADVPWPYLPGASACLSLQECAPQA